MNKSQKQKSSPILVFVVALSIIFIVIIVSNRRSPVVAQLILPLNNGIANLSTCGTFLSAVTNDDKFYVWDWTNLSKKPREGIVESDQTALITPDAVVSVKRTNPDSVVISGLDANETRRKIYLPTDSGTAFLGVNQDRSRIVLLLVRNNNSDETLNIDLLDVLTDAQHVQPIFTIDSESGNVGHLSVSNEGNRVVVVGEKNEQGWMLVADLKEKRVVWQKEMPDFKKIFRAAFSANGEIIYARGTDSTLLVLNSDSGEEIRRLLPVKENKSTYRIMPVQAVVVSHDGSIVAAAVVSTVYIWDTKTVKILGSLGGGQKILSSIAISPDSKLLATSNLRQGGKIIIQRIPR
jgi:dipeptidyl aminopeptidase/acylaminoacyl peptidase